MDYDEACWKNGATYVVKLTAIRFIQVFMEAVFFYTKHLVTYIIWVQCTQRTCGETAAAPSHGKLPTFHNVERPHLRNLYTLMQGRGWLGMHGSWKLTTPISCPSQISGAPGKNWSQCVVSPLAGISMQIASSYRSGIFRLHSSGFTITAMVSTMSSSCSSPKPTTTQLTGSCLISSTGNGMAAARFEERKIAAICLSYNLSLSSILSIVLLEDAERTHLSHISQNLSLIFSYRRYMLPCCSD
uniref:Uncharacterized protein n=1 Tax=Glossina palpalis gambiensis TaxID=67801 RepID=A0A1B0BXP7_9MUSC